MLGKFGCCTIRNVERNAWMLEYGIWLMLEYEITSLVALCKNLVAFVVVASPDATKMINFRKFNDLMSQQTLHN